MLDALQWFVDLGSIVVLPILIFIFRDHFRNKTRKSIYFGVDSWCWFCRIESSN